MKLVGLTGGIGCGKTTVLQEFQKLGVPCFIADQHASEYYKDSSFLKEIKDILGDNVILPNGTADKARIASIVFNDKEALQRLNAKIHPRVMNDFMKWASEQNTPYVIIESAIIYEYQLDKKLDKIISVYLEKEERMQRLMLRDKTTRELLELRIRNQMSAEEKMDRADYVILNYEGNPRQRQVAIIDEMLKY